MIDIYSFGPYIGIIPLLSDSIKELLQYALSFSIYLFLFFVIEKFFTGFFKK